MKLIKMTDFMSCDLIHNAETYTDCFKIARNYANFLKRKINIDELISENKLLCRFTFKEYDKLIAFDNNGKEIFIYSKTMKVFHGFEIETYEDLIKYDLTITELGLQKILEL